MPKKLAPIGALVLALALVACNEAVPTADTHICVYDGSRGGGEKLKLQLPPGTAGKSIGGEDIQVMIPASNRFYMASQDDNTRDPLAPKFYSGYARNNTAVEIQGQLRFKFNLPKACDWFPKHGKRNADENGDLKFNARGADANQSGWLRWLAENFGVTMQQITTSVVNKYEWAAMTFDYPSNANEIGEIPKGAKPGLPTDIVLGFDLGRAFTAQINKNLGGDYFCGIDATPTGEIADCPTINFQVIKVEPADKKLLADRNRSQSLKEEIRNAELELEQLKNKRALLQAQLAAANLQAQIDTAKCRAMPRGLDCEGHHPTYVYGNQPPSK